MKYIFGISILLFSFGCNSGNSDSAADDKDLNQKTDSMQKYATDVHSYSQPNKVAVTHLDLDINVDMDKHVITGDATYDLERNQGDTVIFDIRDLGIQSVVEVPGDKALDFNIRKGWEYGDALVVTLKKNTNKLCNKTYSESKPNSEGVKIGLCVKV